MRTKPRLIILIALLFATIISPKLFAQGISGTFTVNSDWGTGYCAEIVLTNNETQSINNWTFDFDLNAEITSFWNVGSWSGSQAQGYTSTDAGWNANIAPGQSVTLGFCANYTGSIVPPGNAFLNSIPVAFGNGGGGSQNNPTVSITSPANGAVVQQNTIISLQASAADSDGNVTSVIFNVDNQNITAVNTQGNTWEAEWTAASIGSFNIVATATDNDNLSSDATINIVVQGNNTGNTLQLTALPLQINFNTSETVTYDFDQNITTVLSRNLNVVDIAVNGNQVTLTGLNPGRTGLRISSAGQDYFMGVRVNNTDGTPPGMPDYLSVGSVSEDSYGDLAFWKDVNIGNQNKSMDIRYIYINGGPLTGWQSWGPNRPESFATESLRYGLIPFFVYYNIPDGGESYYTDMQHVNDVNYMTAYFNDLNNFMDKAESVMQGELYGIILEPDFLGYIQQNANPSDPELVTTCVSATTIAPQAGNVKTLVERINNTINAKRAAGHNIFYGWQLNLWSYPISGAPQGVIRITDQLGFDAGRSEIHTAAEQTTLYGINAGVLSGNPNFLSIDKYGLDAMGYQNTPNPANSTWFFNNDHWMNYLYYVKTMYETSGYPIILWQLPVGHINNSQTVSAYTGSPFTPLPNTTKKYEDSSTPFFLGDTFSSTNPDRLTYFTENLYGDTELQASGNNITWGNHMQNAKDAGVISTLFGAGVGISTDGIGDPATDDYFWVQKVQDYYLSGPVNLDWSMFNACDGGCPPNVSITSPANGEDITTVQLTPINIDVTAWDPDGTLSSLSVEIDGQSYQLGTTGYTHTLNWTPPAFGTYGIIATATDGDGLINIDSVTFSITEFNQGTCNEPLWDENTVYALAGNQVSWNGNIYENKWWTKGDEPGVGGWSDPWEFISQCTTQSNQATGISENTSNDILNMEIYPNPANKLVVVSFYASSSNASKVLVYNTMGKLVKEKQFPSVVRGINIIELNIDDVARGVYNVMVSTANGKSSKLLVVTK